jgi:hypothetical protein
VAAITIRFLHNVKSRPAKVGDKLTTRNQNDPRTHHDALEFPDGQIVLLTFLHEGLQATVLQLPATSTGSKAPQRAAYV